MNYLTLTRNILFILLTLNGDSHAKQRVCIVGAGMSGLASIRLLSDYPGDFEIISYEKNSDVGGMWIYTNNTDVDDHGLPVHSSLYKNMRINLPKEVMTYPDYQEFKGKEDRSYVHHESVLEYLRNYTEYFNLRQYIKFDTLIEKIIPMDNTDWTKTKWKVLTRNLNTNENHQTICNSIMICNGNSFKPNIPEIPGMESFPGPVIHSHIYRHPEKFTGKKVVLLGASTSGTDIGLELTSYAETVYLSSRHEKLVGDFPDNLIQVRGVVAANGSELILQDGSKVIADAFIYCTGYLYEFPFLDESSDIFIRRTKHVHSLYKYIVNVNHPSMAFIGIPYLYIKGPFFYSQIKFFVNLLRGKITLPSYEAMIEDSKRSPLALPMIEGDEVYDPEWGYYDDLAREGGFKTIPSFYENIMKLAILNSAKHVDFKDFDLKFSDNGDAKFVRKQTC